ncbi:MAG: DUF2513 domain-containing protein [Campylobacterales bacterium]|nr:DUF2513 domain-containing protein [Campylobacterales bacterium]
MKRDMDLLREIMLYLEEKLDYAASDSIDSFPMSDDLSYTSDEAYNKMAYHIQLLLDDGLIDARKLSMGGINKYLILTITSKGHDFIDTLRDSKVWEYTKEKVKSIGGFTVALLLDVGKDYLKKQLGL